MPRSDPALDSFRAQLRDLLPVLLADAPEWDRNASLPKGLFRTFGDAGLLGGMVPAAYGGSQRGYMFSVVLAEECMRLRAPGPAVSLLLQSNTICPLFVRFASPPLRARWLPPLVRGEIVGSLAVTDPSGGSALLEAIQCTAVDDGTHWVLNGDKLFITNGPIADVVLVLARTSPVAGPFSMTLIAVPADTAGFAVVKELHKAGLRSSPTGWLRFTDCRVPKANTVGAPDRGYIQAFSVMREERLLIAIGAIAMAQVCIDRTAAFLAGRIIGGAPVLRRDSLRHELAQMATDVAAHRALGLAVAGEVAAGRIDAERTSMCKFALCETGQRIIRRCVQLHASHGLCEESWTAAAIRDARAFGILAGNSETMRELVGARLVQRSSGQSTPDTTELWL